MAAPNRYNGGGTVGGGSARSPGGNTGLTTTKTWQGNTAIGPAGGTATAYATRSPTNTPNNLAASGGSASYGRPGSIAGGTFSNFRSPSGASLFSMGGGAPGGAGVYGNTGAQALAAAAAQQAALRQNVQPAGGPAMRPRARPQGLLDPVQPGLVAYGDPDWGSPGYPPGSYWDYQWNDGRPENPQGYVNQPPAYRPSPGAPANATYNPYDPYNNPVDRNPARGDYGGGARNNPPGKGDFGGGVSPRSDYGGGSSMGYNRTFGTSMGPNAPSPSMRYNGR